MDHVTTRPNSDRTHRRRHSRSTSSSEHIERLRRLAIPQLLPKSVHTTVGPADWGAGQWRFWLFLAIILLSAGLGVRILQQATGNLLAVSSPEWALRFDGSNSTALVALARQKLEPSQQPIDEETKQKEEKLALVDPAPSLLDSTVLPEQVPGMSDEIPQAALGSTTSAQTAILGAAIGRTDRGGVNSGEKASSTVAPSEVSGVATTADTSAAATRPSVTGTDTQVPTDSPLGALPAPGAPLPGAQMPGIAFGSSGLSGGDAGSQGSILGSKETFEEVRTLAQRALIANPLEARALRLLGMVADAQGDTDLARELMSNVAERTRRDLQAQAWLLEDRAKAEDFRAELAHADNILRVLPGLRRNLQPRLESMAGHDEARAALVQALATSPPWRFRFLDSLNSTDPNVVASAPRLFAELKATGSPATDMETSRYLTGLLRIGSVHEAYNSWVALLPDDRLETLMNVYNGDFRYPPTVYPFDWKLQTNRSGYSIAIRPLYGAPAPQVLSVDFGGGRTPFKAVSQWLVLEPGNYSLTGAVSAPSLNTPRGMQWRVYCPSMAIVGQSELFRGRIEWRGFESLFTIPEGCPQQLLRLELAARVPAEEEVSGQINFTNMAIRRVP